MHDSTETKHELDPGLVERMAKRETARAEANVIPLPGPLLDAFLPPLVFAAGQRLRPMTASDVAILQRINSPLIRMMVEAGKPPEEQTPVVTTDEELWELLFLWTRPAREARAAIAPGPQAFREAALSFADTLPFGIIVHRQAIFHTLEQHFASAMATALSYRAANPEGTVFTPPPAGPGMGSVGGSTTQPGS